MVKVEDFSLLERKSDTVKMFFDYKKLSKEALGKFGKKTPKPTPIEG